MRRGRNHTLRGTGAATALLLLATACGGGSERDDNTIHVAYLHFGTGTVMDPLMRQVKEEFEAENPDVTIELNPIEAPPEDYQTQVNLMNRSPSEAPDIIYQDTFTINQDSDAGYLAPLDDYFNDWADSQYYTEQEAAAVTALDGTRYGVMLSTDVRGLWYNTELLEEAGIDTPWEPETWDDILEAARAVRSELGDDVIPLNVYSGTPAGEAASMQGFQMLLSGTDDWIFEESSGNWVTSSDGFRDSLEFIETIYDEGLTHDPQDALDTNIGTLNNEEHIPAGELAINLDGSWVPRSWGEEANQPWPEWQDTMDFVPMPTQNGQEPGITSMSGGWALSMGAHSSNPDLAWEVMTHALSKEHNLQFVIDGSYIPVRTDVAEDPEFLESSPLAEEFAALVPITTFRPAYSEYPQVSLAIQEAMEGVMLGDATPEEAMELYAEEVEGIVGADNVSTSS